MSLECGMPVDSNRSKCLICATNEKKV